MPDKSHFDKLETLDRLIRIKGTGTPRQLAAKLEVSERTVFRLITCMRLLGAPVAWSETRKSYYYKEEGTLVFCFQKACKS